MAPDQNQPPHKARASVFRVSALPSEFINCHAGAADSQQTSNAAMASDTTEIVVEGNTNLTADQFTEPLSRQEAVLRTICSRLPTAEVVQEQLDLLRRTQHQMASESTETQSLLNAFLQFTRLLFGILFGVFCYFIVHNWHLVGE
jgi:hypothetical protein